MFMDFQLIFNMRLWRRWRLVPVVLPILCIGAGCKKLVSIVPPQNDATTATVFSTDALAVAAVAGIYSNLINNGYVFSANASTIMGGLSSDELEFFDRTDVSAIQLQNNTLLSNNSYVYSAIWAPCYSTIYGCNAVIEGLNEYSGVDDSTKTELLGEVRFIRALAYFYATNFFGKIPLVLSTNWQVTRTYSNSPTQAIYQQIISDLLFAQQVLPTDYSVANGERTRANKWAATALLARVHLYQSDWADAFTQANAVIGNSQYAIIDSLDQVFNANSPEAIFQLQPATNSTDYTPEGVFLVPDPPLAPYATLTPGLLNAFEQGDNRRNEWVDSIYFNGTMYYTPFKYNIGRLQAQFNVPFPQYYMVLRLAEQYLIRAEAEANGAGNGLSAAILDLDVIRNRAGLDSLSDGLSQSQVLQAIVQERRIELFAEWGHRWFDLKRTGDATTVLSAEKNISVDGNALLYPIPQLELIADPSLQQNPGYQ